MEATTQRATPLGGSDDGAPGNGWEPRLPLAEARQQLGGLLGGETDLIANAANVAAFLNTLLPDINWLGFYFLQGEELVLGPFQGAPACVRIPLGRGVCGTCVASGVSQRVADVHDFPGHIACDPRSRSELVVPVRAAEGISEDISDGIAERIVGVLDIDSPVTGRFSAADQSYVEALVDEFSTRQFGQS